MIPLASIAQFAIERERKGSAGAVKFPFENICRNDTISYVYSAAGKRLGARLNAQTSSGAISSLTFYRSVMVYAQDGNGVERLQYMLQPEGLVARTEGTNGETFTYKYFKTDHTGSTRVLLAARPSAGVIGLSPGDAGYWSMDVEQSTDYYPFGLAWETNDLHQNKYLYSGKEIETAELNGSPLALYYFGARYYNPTLGRWFNQDPALQLANPYLYCGNNPVMFTDPNGE